MQYKLRLTRVYHIASFPFVRVVMIAVLSTLAVRIELFVRQHGAKWIFRLNIAHGSNFCMNLIFCSFMWSLYTKLWRDVAFSSCRLEKRIHKRWCKQKRTLESLKYDRFYFVVRNVSPNYLKWLNIIKLLLNQYHSSSLIMKAILTYSLQYFIL